MCSSGETEVVFEDLKVFGDSYQPLDDKEDVECASHPSGSYTDLGQKSRIDEQQVPEDRLAESEVHEIPSVFMADSHLDLTTNPPPSQYLTTHPPAMQYRRTNPPPSQYLYDPTNGSLKPLYPATTPLTPGYHPTSTQLQPGYHPATSQLQPGFHPATGPQAPHYYNPVTATHPTSLGQTDGAIQSGIPAENGQIPSAACEQVSSSVTVQTQAGDTDAPSACSRQQSAQTSARPEVVMICVKGKPLTCINRDKNFIKLGKLKTQQYVHSGGKPYKCKDCDKSFLQLGDLNRHERIHTGEKLFHCQQCDKAFSRFDSLTKHKLVHTGEKKFRCNQCDKSFSQSSNLNTHLRLHTGARPFHCKECDNSFRALAHLTAHQRQHTGEKPYKCQQCDRSYTRSAHLKAHMHLHSFAKSRPSGLDWTGRAFLGLQQQISSPQIAQGEANVPPE